MITDKITFKAQKNAPSPKEVDYWIDTATDPNGGTIKYNDGKEWTQLNSKGDDNASTDEPVFDPHRKITAKYFISEDQVGTKVKLAYGQLGLDPTAVTKLKVDDKSIDPTTIKLSEYIFDSAGEHVVEMEVKTNVTLSGAFDSIDALFEVDLSQFKFESDSDISGLFRGSQNLEYVTFHGADLSETTLQFYQTFKNTTSLKNVDISNITINKISDYLILNETFYGSGLEQVNFNKLFENVTLPSNIQFHGTFQYCKNLKKFIMNGIHANIMSNTGIFIESSNLEEIQMRDNLIYEGSISSICSGNNSLKLLDLSGTEFYKVGLQATFSSIGSNLDKPILDVKLYGTKFVGCNSGGMFSSSKIKSINIDCAFASDMDHSGAFSGATLPTTIEVKQNQTDLINDGAFSNCIGLHELIFENISYYRPLTGLNSNGSIKTVVFENVGIVNLYTQFASSTIQNVVFTNVNKIENLYAAFVSTKIQSIDFSSVSLRDCHDMAGAFSGCTLLTEVRMKGSIPADVDVTNMFQSVTTTGTFYYDGNYDYSKIIAVLPETWTAVDTSAQ